MESGEAHEMGKESEPLGLWRGALHGCILAAIASGVQERVSVLRVRVGEKGRMKGNVEVEPGLE